MLYPGQASSLGLSVNVLLAEAMESFTLIDTEEHRLRLRLTESRVLTAQPWCYRGTLEPILTAVGPHVAPANQYKVYRFVIERAGSFLFVLDAQTAHCR